MMLPAGGLFLFSLGVIIVIVVALPAFATIQSLVQMVLGTEFACPMIEGYSCYTEQNVRANWWLIPLMAIGSILLVFGIKRMAFERNNREMVSSRK